MKNIKNIYLILGLGIGIILSNVLYSMFPQVRYVDLSDSDIIERAEELGYVSLKEKINLKENKEELKKSVEIPLEEDQIKEIDKKTEEIIEEKKDRIIEVKVAEGDTLKDISKKLLELGLIANEEDFILAVEKKEMDKKFAYGKFYIPLNSDYPEIINLLTR